MYTVWHVDKYKITFKLVNNQTNEILQHIVVSSGLSRPGIIDARARYRAPAWRLRYTALHQTMKVQRGGEVEVHSLTSVIDGVGPSTAHSCRFKPGTFQKRLDGSQGRPGRMRKISPQQEFELGFSNPQLVAMPTELSRPNTSSLCGLQCKGFRA